MIYARNANLKYKFKNRNFWEIRCYVNTVGLNTTEIHTGTGKTRPDRSTLLKKEDNSLFNGIKPAENTVRLINRIGIMAE